MLVAGMAAAAVLLFTLVVRRMPTVTTGPHLPWWLWAVAFIVGELVVVHVQWNREAHTYSASDLVLAAALLLASPVTVVATHLFACAVVITFQRRQRGLKLTFNLAGFALAPCVAVSVYGLAHTITGDSFSWVAALLGPVVSMCSTVVTIFVVISLSEGRAPWKRLWQMSAQSVAFALAFAAAGAALGRGIDRDPTALLLFAFPAAMTVSSYRAAMRSQSQQENMQLLHNVTSLLHAGEDSHQALGEFLTAVRSAFRARTAELVLLGNDGSRSSSQEGAAPVVMAALEDSESYLLLLRQLGTTAALRTRTGRRGGGPLDVYATGHGLKDAMAAVLRTEDRVHGLLLVSDRHGDATTFHDNDVVLLETFARHVATSLERGRLEETLRQVTDLKEQLRHQALHDSLTGLPNRALFLDRVRQAVHLAQRSEVWPAVLFIDLDGFKPVNDTYGHDAGDVLLRTLANRMRGCLRPSDTAARLGGDEFAVLLTGPVDEHTLAQTVQRLQTQVTVPVDLGAGRVVQVGMSVGGALGGPDVADADTLIREADVAMYTAKRGGGHDYVLYEPGLGDTGSRRQDAVAELAAAVDNGELFTVYQPLVDLRTGRTRGAEALVRWGHPDGVRAPDAFIGLAEDSGLITQIGILVLRDACAQAARWTQAGAAEDTLVTVNLSARQVADPGIVGQVAAALSDAGLEPHRLVLEITETVLMADRDGAAATLWALKRLGVRIAIDDFGTGYSSLAYLRRFPLDMLKVAREFVDGLGRDAADDVITHAIVDLAAALHLSTIAEGIETVAQQQQLTRLGVDLAQGYLYARPMPAEEMLATIGQRTPVAAGTDE